jgi:hypothetical protein
MAQFAPAELNFTAGFLSQQSNTKTRTALFFKPFRVKKINELVVSRTNNKLNNNFAGLGTSDHEPDVARGPPL